MISSRNNDKVTNVGGAILLSDIRTALKAEIEGIRVNDIQLYEVWINELAGAQSGDQNAWDTCMNEVDNCDILIGLYNGESGWSLHPNGLGICHAELHRAFSIAASKMYVVKVGQSVDSGGVAINIDDIVQKNKNNEAFKNFIDSTTFYDTAIDEEEIKRNVREIVVKATIDLTRLAKRETKRGKYHLGESLNWSRMNYQERKKVIEEEIIKYFIQSLSARPEANVSDKAVNLSSIVYIIQAIPSNYSISEARELVGRPYLNDVTAIENVSTRKIYGPVHIIACHKGITEAQVYSFMGHPDIYCVETPFGYFTFDRISFVQCIFLVDCRDSASTRNNLERFFEWISRSEEEKRINEIANSRFSLLKQQLLEKKRLKRKMLI